MARNRVVISCSRHALQRRLHPQPRTNVIARHYGLPLTRTVLPGSTPGTYDTLLLHAAGVAHRDGVCSPLPKHPMDWYGPQTEVKDGLVRCLRAQALASSLHPKS